MPPPPPPTHTHTLQVGCLEEDKARVLVAEVVLALECCHSKGIIHRDLKVWRMPLTWLWQP